MYELRVVALTEDARHVVLAPVLEGRRERYRVAVDDRLRAALRGELGRLERRTRPDSSLPPREIQARMRAGESAETIATVAGVPVEWILRFEAPVLAERAQVARQARRSSMSVSGGEWTGVPLEEIVDARLEADGMRPESTNWDAWRRDDGRWVVQLRSGALNAHWLWDPALQRLIVHDDAARALLHPGTTRPVTEETPAAEPRRLALAPRPVEELPARAPESSRPEDVDAIDRPSVELPPDSPAEADAGSAGPGLAAELPPSDPAVTIPVTADEAAALANRPRRAARRQAVPSWEDILLGTGTGPGGSSG